jgi:hypothetical protein
MTSIAMGTILSAWANIICFLRLGDFLPSRDTKKKTFFPAKKAQDVRSEVVRRARERIILFPPQTEREKRRFAGRSFQRRVTRQSSRAATLCMLSLGSG